MLRAKVRLPTRGDSESGSEIHIHGAISPEMRHLSSQYSYSGYNKARYIQQDINCSLLSMLMLMLLCSLISYGFILGVRYMLTATEYYGEQEKCLISEVRFNGWSFKYDCIVCQEGWMPGEKGLCKLAHEGH